MKKFYFIALVLIFACGMSLLGAVWGYQWWFNRQIQWSNAAERLLNGKVTASELQRVVVYFFPEGASYHQFESEADLESLPHVVSNNRVQIEALTKMLAQGETESREELQSLTNWGVLRADLATGDTAYLYWASGSTDVMMLLPRKPNDIGPGVPISINPHLHEWFKSISEKSNSEQNQEKPGYK